MANLDSQIESLKTPINTARRIAALFYYSSAFFLWTGGLALVLWLSLIIFQTGIAAGFGIVIIGLIYGLPGWVWGGIGVFLFLNHKAHYLCGIGSEKACALWISTAFYNLAQSWFLFKYGNGKIAAVVILWNLLMILVSLAALVFEITDSRKEEF